MCEAIGTAAADAGLRRSRSPTRSASSACSRWRYGDPGYLVAEQLGLTPRETGVHDDGRQQPAEPGQRDRLEIQAGELDLAILAGGEAWRTRMRARKAERARLADGAGDRRRRGSSARNW